MIPEKIRAVVCDLDGTLLPRSRELPDSARDMICRLYAHGVYFGIASGRPLDELVRLVGIWGLEKEIPLFISMNGAELWDGVDKKEYGYFKLKPEWIRQVIEELEPFHLNPYVYFHGKFPEGGRDRQRHFRVIRGGECQDHVPGEEGADGGAGAIPGGASLSLL